MDDGKLSVALSGSRREFIEEELAAGSYASEADVVDAALDLLERKKKLDDVRALIAESEADVAAGRVYEYETSEDFLADIRREDGNN